MHNNTDKAKPEGVSKRAEKVSWILKKGYLTLR